MQLQRDERCVRRAVWLMGLFTALAIAGLGYSALFLADFPQNKSHLALKLFGALGLASLISLLAFVAFWAAHRKEMGQRREECRRLAAKFLESRLGKPPLAPLSVAGIDRENAASENRGIVAPSEIGFRPSALSGTSRSADGILPARAVGRWDSGSRMAGDSLTGNKQTAKPN